MPRMRKKSASPVLSKSTSKKEDLSQHSLTLSRSRRTIKPNKKYLSEDLVILSNKSSRSGSPSDGASAHSEDEEVQLSEEEFEEEPEPRITRKTVLSTPARKVQMKAKATVEKRFSRTATPAKSNLFAKIKKANAIPKVLSKSSELKRLEIMMEGQTPKGRERATKLSPQPAAPPAAVAAKPDNTPERRITRINKENSPASTPPSNDKRKVPTPTSTPMLDPMSCFVQIEKLKLPESKKDADTAAKEAAQQKKTIEIKRKTIEVKKKAEDVKKKVEDLKKKVEESKKKAEPSPKGETKTEGKKKSEAPKTSAPLAIDFEDFEDALPVFQCSNQSAEEEKLQNEMIAEKIKAAEPKKKIDVEELKKKIQERRLTEERKVKEYENKKKAATDKSAADDAVITLVNINDIIKGVPAKPTEQAADLAAPKKPVVKSPTTAATKVVAAKTVTRNFATSTPMPKAGAKKRPMSADDTDEEITPIKRVKQLTKKEATKSADEHEGDLENFSEDDPPIRPKRKTINGKQVELKTDAAKKESKATITKRPVDENAQKSDFLPTSLGTKGNKLATIRPKVATTVSPPKLVIPERGKGSPKLLNKSPPKILNSTLNKNAASVGTTVSLKSKNDGGATFTLKTTSPKTNNNNTIEAANKARTGQDNKLATNRRSNAPVVSKRTVGGTTISTILPKTPAPVVRRVTTFETWYVINVPPDNNEKQDTVMELSLVTLGNNVKTLELPSSEWSYRITLSRLTEKEAAQRIEENREVYTGDMSNDANAAEVERNNYEPTNIMFRRLSQNQKLSIQYDRAVIFKNKNFLINIEGKYVSLVGCPQNVTSLEDVVTLLAIVDETTLTNSCVETL